MQMLNSSNPIGDSAERTTGFFTALGMQALQCRLGMLALALVAVGFLTACGRSDVKWLNVRGPAEIAGYYYGWLCDKGETLGPSVIVDFGRPIQLATDDIIEAKFRRTERIGRWMDTDLRIYVPNGDIRTIDQAELE